MVAQRFGEAAAVQKVTRGSGVVRGLAFMRRGGLGVMAYSQERGGNGLLHGVRCGHRLNKTLTGGVSCQQEGEKGKRGTGAACWARARAAGPTAAEELERAVAWEVSGPRGEAKE